MNYYETLEVSPNASPAVIKAAYRSLMQRYHPDKNPNNSAVAAQAVRVALAYEVLSDAVKRAAYDLQFKQHLANQAHALGGLSEAADGQSARNDGRDVKTSTPYTLWWFLILVTILSSLWLLKHLGGKAPANAPISERVNGVVAKLPDDPAREEASRIIPVYMSDLSVNLSGAGGAEGLTDATGASGDAGHVLHIPELGIKVGSYEAEKILLYVENNKALIQRKVALKLASAKADELGKVGGAQYLKTMILDSIGETSGANRLDKHPPTSAENPGRYGVVEVYFPKSFSVKENDKIAQEFPPDKK